MGPAVRRDAAARRAPARLLPGRHPGRALGRAARREPGAARARLGAGRAAGAAPPLLLLPDRFEELLEEKSFGVEGDRRVVSDIYRSTYALLSGGKDDDVPVMPDGVGLVVKALDQLENGENSEDVPAVPDGVGLVVKALDRLEKAV